jgi:hypothetical protein
VEIFDSGHARSIAMGQVQAYAGGSNTVLKDWTFGGPTPTSLVDKSGSGNHGTFTGITLVQLASGLWTYQFNGSTSYINVSDTLGLNITARPLTIAAWVKPAADVATSYFVCRNLDSAANVQYGVYYSSTGLPLRIRLENADVCYGDTGSITLGAWQLIGFTWSAAGVPQCYVNGIANGAAGAAVTSALTARANISIGRRADSGYFKGDMALMSVLPVEWTAADWLKAYNFERKFFGV